MNEFDRELRPLALGIREAATAYLEAHKRGDVWDSEVDRLLREATTARRAGRLLDGIALEATARDRACSLVVRKCVKSFFE